jgi:hypothetical protein
MHVGEGRKPGITATNNISILNWDEIIKTKKGVRASD